MNNKFFVEKFDEEVLNLFKTGNNITEIAKILKIAVNRVSESMDKQNIQREKAPFRKEIVDVIKKLRADGVSLKRIETYLNENYLGFHGLAKIRQVLKG
jgi:DNA-binding transcriptional MerR regulator